MTQNKEREAACACGQLAIRLAGEPEVISSCHCLACQRRTGSLFGVHAFFRNDRVLAIRGEHRTYRRQADSGTWVEHKFCPTCGTTLCWERPSLPGMISVAVGAFADPGFGTPARTVWTESKHDWLSFPAGMPHFPKAPPA